LNGVLVFQSADRNLSLCHRWFQNLLEKSDNKEELSSFIAEENGQYLNTFTDAFHDPTIIGDATSSGYYRSSLSGLLPHIFNGLDTKYIYSIQIDGSIALDQVGRVHFDVGTLGNRVQIKDLSLKLIESKHMLDVVRPDPLLTLKCPKWHQKVYSLPFASLTTTTINITQDFPLIYGAKRVFFGMTESSASTPENCFMMHHGDITGIELKVNGVSRQNLATKGQIHAHMNKYYMNNTGHHSHFPPGITAYGQFQWLFFNFVSCDYPNINKGNNKKINIVGGVSSKVLRY